MIRRQIHADTVDISVQEKKYICTENQASPCFLLVAGAADKTTWVFASTVTAVARNGPTVDRTGDGTMRRDRDVDLVSWVVT